MLVKLHDFKKNLKIWSILVSVYSLPYIAFTLLNRHSSCNLQLHIIIFFIILSIIFYSLFTSTSFFTNIKNNKKTFYKALKIAVILKIITVFPLDNVWVAMFSYMITGEVLSIDIPWKTCPHEWWLFSTNFVLGLVHIAVVNIIIISSAILIWIFIKLWTKLFKKEKIK
ncbi:MAG: hypothetical protein PQ612_09985 [Rickettsiales bacterium]|nr:hypothetical protein [Pseudomonadota bacterium]MDA0967168.1 hypothetical protein [Pseudomonadota bacterium]MDG4544353.1 hypothetical protein [Rickettsiales bacterium]MDG4546483.1 hypothetical protein [Rickettsiales bacterium]MDG4548629.1 hypothetical protein [Rickettsiales bacterium]